MTDGPIALVDMDGTVADYDTGMKVYLDPLRSPEETGPLTYHGISEKEPDFYRARVRLIRNQAGWWENLLTLPDGLQIVGLLKKLGFEIHVLTKGPSSSPNAWTEKVTWCKRHLPDVPVTITSNKGMVYGRVLVDDWPPYVKAWLKYRPRGLVILPDRPWNRGFNYDNVVRACVNETPGHREEGLLANIDEIYLALRGAFDRAEGQPLKV